MYISEYSCNPPPCIPETVAQLMNVWVVMDSMSSCEITQCTSHIGAMKGRVVVGMSLSLYEATGEGLWPIPSIHQAHWHNEGVGGGMSSCEVDSPVVILPNWWYSEWWVCPCMRSPERDCAPSHQFTMAHWHNEEVGGGRYICPRVRSPERGLISCSTREPVLQCMAQVFLV